MSFILFSPVYWIHPSVMCTFVPALVEILLSLDVRVAVSWNKVKAVRVCQAQIHSEQLCTTLCYAGLLFLSHCFSLKIHRTVFNITFAST